MNQSLYDVKLVELIILFMIFKKKFKLHVHIQKTLAKKAFEIKPVST